MTRKRWINISADIDHVSELRKQFLLVPWLVLFGPRVQPVYGPV
jgi:hypothetical protein